MDILELNRNKIDSNIIYDMMIYSIKGKYLCEESRKSFALHRGVPSQKAYDADAIAPHAKSFLDCYAGMVENTKLNKNCQDKFKNVNQCLSSHKSQKEDFPIKCVSFMEDFINC